MTVFFFFIASPGHQMKYFISPKINLEPCLWLGLANNLTLVKVCEIYSNACLKFKKGLHHRLHFSAWFS